MRTPWSLYWEEDIELENDLKEQVSRNLWQSEIVDFMKVKYKNSVMITAGFQIQSREGFSDCANWCNMMSVMM